ncbi:UNVERIFIED_CONTAM: hypothetical protein Sangu_0662800 [Sesamum angustifolium]|uniref:Secreted protein n=1 Tax=Sesamum angustifolium TaxID=2727405 RepID=A0AAW2QCS2_9LAMI
MGRLLFSATLLSLIFNFSLFPEVDSTTFKIVNKCRPHDMARNTDGRRQAITQSHRLCSPEWKIQNSSGTQVLVGSVVGSNPLLH